MTRGQVAAWVFGSLCLSIAIGACAVGHVAQPVLAGFAVFVGLIAYGYALDSQVI